MKCQKTKWLWFEKRYKKARLVVHNNMIVLDEKEYSPTAPWVNEPGVGVVERRSNPDEEEHCVDKKVDSSVNVQITEWLVVVLPYVLRNLGVC